MSRKTKKQREAEMRKQPQAADLADDPMADDFDFDSLDMNAKLTVEDLVGADDGGKAGDGVGTKDAISDGKEPEEKCRDAVIMLPGGPTSFEELDAAKEAREKANEIEDVTWDTRRIVRNVINSDMEPEEKAEKISKAGKDMAARITQISKKEAEETGEIDIELLEIEVLLKNFGKVNLVKKLKSKIKGYDDLEDEDFAHLLPGGERVFPIHDEAHVQKALVDITLGLKEGGNAAEIARSALPKVRDAVRSMSKMEGTTIIVEKDINDEWRWLGLVSNNFKDREGDIITEAAHKEFISWLDSVAEEKPEAIPEFWSWHTPGTARKSKPDFWDYRNGFLIFSGPLTEDEAVGLLTAQKEYRLGMSHQFFAKRNPLNPNIIDKYRTFEVCDLSLNKAANIWTDLEAMKKEVTMSDEKLKHLTLVLGEKKVEALLGSTEAQKEFLEEIGVESKEKEEKPTETAETLKELVPLLVKELGKAFDLEKLSEMVVENSTGLKAVVEKLEIVEKDVDEQVADKFESPLAKAMKQKRPTEDPEAEAKEDEDKDMLEAKKKAGSGTDIPKEDWFSQLAQVPALEAEGGVQ